MDRFLIVIEIYRTGSIDKDGNALYEGDEDYTFLNPQHIARIRSTQRYVKTTVMGEVCYQPFLCYEVQSIQGGKLLCYPDDPEETFCQLTGRNKNGDLI